LLFYDRLHDHEPPDLVSWIDFPLAYSPIPQTAAPIQTIKTFKIVRLIFFQFKT
jgi:hypothetical protein